MNHYCIELKDFSKGTVSFTRIQTTDFKILIKRRHIWKVFLFYPVHYKHKKFLQFFPIFKDYFSLLDTDPTWIRIRNAGKNSASLPGIELKDFFYKVGTGTHTREIDVCEAGQKVVLVCLKGGLLAQEPQEAVSLDGRPAAVPGVHAQLLSPALAPQGGGHRAT